MWISFGLIATVLGLSAADAKKTWETEEKLEYFGQTLHRLKLVREGVLRRASGEKDKPRCPVDTLLTRS